MSISIRSGLVVLLVGLLAWALNVPAMAPPLGVTAYLSQRSPTALASQPKSALLGHGLGIVCGLLSLALCGAHGMPSALAGVFTVQHACAAGLAIALTTWSTEALAVPHPPAAATTLIVALGVLTSGPQLLAFAGGSIATVAIGWLFAQRTTPSKGGYPRS